MSRADLPQSWADWLERFAHLVGGGDDGAAEARVWLEQAVEAAHGTPSLRALSRIDRAVAFQRACGVLIAVREQPDVTFRTDHREAVSRAFARYFGGAALEGPPWRLSPTELDRPLWRDYVGAADFAEAS